MSKENQKNQKSAKKSVFEIAQEMEQQEQEQQRHAQEILQKQKEQQRLAYEEQLRQEKLELIRLKQGVIEESTTIYEEHEDQKKYTIFQKISNFFYANQWWMGICGFFVVLAGFLVWQVVTTVHPDMIILLVSHNDLFHASCSEGISDIFEQYIDDINQDGEVIVDVYYMPSSPETQERDGYTGDNAKLYAEFQTGEAVLVISDSDADEFIVPEHTLVNLEEYFGDYEETEDMRFLLSGTAFADVLEYDEPLDDDIYIGIRQVRETMDSIEKMQEVYDIAFPALEKFIQEFGHLKNSEEN
ncbi:MAG: SGNH/GDSL hydrolase family protein [Oscillospiraceae bacterium]|nr:SGNH/GDSL hydrolase family protein [Oscillospiraceae bacterium]